MLRQAQYSHHDFFTSYAAPQIKILHGKASISDRADSSRRRSQHRTFRQCVQFINQTPPKIYTSNLRKKIFFVLSPPDTRKNKNCTFRINTTILHPQHMYYEDALLHHYSTTTPSQREYPEEKFFMFLNQKLDNSV